MVGSLIDKTTAISLFKMIGMLFLVVLAIFSPLMITGLIYYFYLNKKIENLKGRLVVTAGICIFLYILLLAAFFFWGR